MGIVIQDPTIGKDAEAIATKLGVSVEEAIGVALREKLQREEKKNFFPPFENLSDDEILGYNKYGHCNEQTPEQRKASYSRARAIIEEYRALPLYDDRSMDEILGYNEHGTLE